MNLRTIEKKISEGKDLGTDEEEYLVKKINDYWEHHPDVSNRYPRWRKYIAWVAGYQLYDYNKISKKLIEVPLTRQHKIVVNKLRPYVRTLLAKLTSEVPQMSIIPNTSEDEDIEAARAGDAIISGLAEKLKFTQTVADVKLWTIICNRGFIRVFWNESDSGLIGYEDVKPEEDDGIESGTTEPMVSSEGTEAQLKAVYEDGDICIQAVPPFNCRVDPLFYNREDWRWFVYGYEDDAEEVESTYEIEKGTLNEKSTIFSQAYSLDLQDEQDMIIGGPDKREDISGRTTVVKELWTNKMWVFASGSKILDYGPNEFNEIPFFVTEERLIPIDTYEKEFQYNESVIKDVIPLQREYNKMISIESIAMDRASKLKVLTPIGSLLSKRQWVNDYGVFIDYNPRAGEPHQMKTDAFPFEMSAYKGTLEREMQAVMNLGPASFGQLPERASHASGALVNLLIEQDDVVLNPLLNRINNVVSEAWSLAMRIVQANYTTDRYIRYVGEDGSNEVAKFQGADLRGNTDVRVISQTGLPRSRALRIEYIMKLREAGMLPDDRANLEMLEFGQVDKIFKEQMIHERRAHRENSMIHDNPNIDPQEAMGWVYPLEPHPIHLNIHLRDRLGTRWNSYNEFQQEALENHIQATQQKIQEQQQQEMEQMAKAQAIAKGVSGQEPPPTAQ